MTFRRNGPSPEAFLSMPTTGSRLGRQRERGQRPHRDAAQLHGSQGCCCPRIRRERHLLREYQDRPREHSGGGRFRAPFLGPGTSLQRLSRSVRVSVGKRVAPYRGSMMQVSTELLPICSYLSSLIFSLSLSPTVLELMNVPCWITPLSRVTYVRHVSSVRQGTVGLELVEQVKELTGGADLDAIIVPVGGGGLISGVATAVKSLCPGIRVIGAEPQKAADAFRSKQVCWVFFIRA